MAQAIRTFRLFVSSTFSDLKDERNALQRRVFPQLRQLAVEHGARFQAIDLRWGVRDEAALDQRTMAICLDEVARCRRMSPRPNFIVLLGDRYGWQPLPSTIPSREMATIAEHIIGPADRDLVARWYRLDENAVPAEYVLQPRVVPLERDGLSTARVAERQEWGQTEASLQRVLRTAVVSAGLPDQSRLKYETSATEQEIVLGALDAPDAREHVFGFLRTIDGLPADRRAADFRDLDANGQPDAESERKLRRLTNDVLRPALGPNLFEYRADWREESVSQDHLEQLCDDVYRELSRVIRNELARLDRVDPLERDIDAHRAFAADRARFFTGRAGVLDAIGALFEDDTGTPVVVHGASGAGKSAVMARVAAGVAMRRPATTVVERYVGITPAASNVRSLLDGVCREISRAYAGDDDTAAVPADFNELVRAFSNRLEMATAERPLLIVLDALDQLTDAGRDLGFRWLPCHLPPHVALAVSTTPGPALDALALRVDPSRLVQVVPMSADEGGQLLDRWLAAAGRALTPDQRHTVLSAFVPLGLPLYLKLAFEEARRWVSYTTMAPLGADVRSVIGALFDRLSLNANHGQVLVSHSLGYLAAARHGLSEDELLDLLSADSDVFDDFMGRARHQPPERRLPAVVWVRLYGDLEPYLTERSADGTVLLAFYHRQLQEAVQEVFLSDATGRNRHRALAAYFAGAPLFASGRIPNLRKLSELPFQQTRGEMWDEVHATLTDFTFLEAKCTFVNVANEGTQTVHRGVYELQEDFRRALEADPSRVQVVPASGGTPTQE